jgi:uncharacterized protein involved in high-affinity Fe2+ transport
MVTLNGRPAYILGSPGKAPFARVVDTETGLGAEWSWKAVEHVLAHGGNFRSK